MKCDKCTFCPDWETGYVMGVGTQSELFKAGECEKNGEPILFYRGKYWVDGSSDTASELKDCKHYENAATEKAISIQDCEGSPIPRNRSERG